MLSKLGFVDNSDENILNQNFLWKLCNAFANFNGKLVNQVNVFSKKDSKIHSLNNRETEILRLIVVENLLIFHFINNASQIGLMSGHKFFVVFIYQIIPPSHCARRRNFLKYRESKKYNTYSKHNCLCDENNS